MTGRQKHWDTVFTTKDPLTFSWYQKVPETSLRLIFNASPDTDSWIIDVGGGSSMLVDSLIEKKFSNITVLDISEKALAVARQRLGDSANTVEWIATDITKFAPSHKYDIWHDRAVLHFLTNYQDRLKYVEVLKKALNPGATVIVAAFAIGGPEKCSGLPIVQYDAEKIVALFGDRFHLVEQIEETHITPSGAPQLFAFFRFQYKP